MGTIFGQGGIDASEILISCLLLYLECLRIHELNVLNPKIKSKKLQQLINGKKKIALRLELKSALQCFSDLPPSQGGKYSGFGNCPTEPMHRSSSVTEFYDSSLGNLTNVSYTLLRVRAKAVRWLLKL